MEVWYSSVMQDNKQRIQSAEVYTTTHGQHQLLNQGASVYVCRFATSTTPVFCPRLLVPLRRQRMWLWRCSCRPTIRSTTALHSNGGIKEQNGRRPPLASTSFIFSFPRPSDGVPVTAAARQRQMICAPAWFRPLLSLSSFFKCPCQSDESFMFSRQR